LRQFPNFVHISIIVDDNQSLYKKYGLILL